MTGREIQTKRYPIRGALYGLLIGLSAAYFLYFQFAVFPFDTLGGVITRFVIIVVVGIVVGVLWAYVAPARKPKEPAPVAAAPETASEHTAEVAASADESAGDAGDTDDTETDAGDEPEEEGTET